MASTLPRPVNTLLNILSILGLALWTVGAFIGLFYISGGSYGISIPLAIAIGGLMSLFLYLMRRYTGFCATGYRIREASKYKWIYFVLYLIMALGSVLFVMHSVAVTTTIKNESQTQALEDLRGLLNLVDASGPDGSYVKYVNGQIDRYRQDNWSENPSTLNFESQQLRQKLMENSGFNRLQNQVTEYWKTADYTVRNWDLMYLPSTINTFNDRQSIWVDSLRNGAERGNTGIYKNMHTPFKTDYQPSSDLYHQFRSFTVADFSGWCIPVAILLQFLILAGWLAMLTGGTHRSGGIDIGKEGGTVWNSSSVRNS